MGFEAVNGIDTNVLLRYLAETAFVLSRFYGVPRERVVDEMVTLLRKRNIVVLGMDKALAASVLLLCRPSGRPSYADALINADTRAHAIETLYTFDDRFPSEGLVLENPV